MKKEDKVTLYWDKKENCIGGSYPLSSVGKNCLHLLFSRLDDKLIHDLTNLGLDVKTLKLSIEPIKGDTRFASQRANNKDKV